MKFEKRNFMGIDLDVLVGHPEHDLLFVATQVARAAGLKNPSASIGAFHRSEIGQKLQVKGLGTLQQSCRDARAVPSNTWLFDEPRVYALLLRSNSPASEPFRKWVTEEVLPAIRKTGKYDAEQSSHPIAQGLMDELKALRSEVVDLKEMVTRTLAQITTQSPQSPYIGTEATTVHYHFKDRQARELLEASGFDRLVADKLMPRVVLVMAEQIRKAWDAEDGRPLDTETSTKQRQWVKFPKDWLLKQMDRTAYQRAIQAVINAAVR